MLHLVFRLEGEAYALDASAIVEILPLVNLSKASRAATGVVGVITYRGQLVPIVDLTAMVAGRPSQRRLSTRIVLMRCAGADMLGLIVENATDLEQIEANDFSSDGLSNEGRGHLGPVAIGPRGPIQRIEADRLAPAKGDGRSKVAA